jgi:hypothetical protein
MVIWVLIGSKSKILSVAVIMLIWHHLQYLSEDETREDYTEYSDISND